MIILIKIIAWIFLILSLMALFGVFLENKKERKAINKSVTKFGFIIMAISAYFAFVYHIPINNDTTSKPISIQTDNTPTPAQSINKDDGKAINKYNTETGEWTKENANTPTPAPIQTPKYIIGSTKDDVKKILSDYSINSNYTNNVDTNALKFENSNLMIVVDFNSKGIAEGICFISINSNEMDGLTGEGSYVSKHYDNLIKLASDNKSIKIENDMKYDKTKLQKKPFELYIGNLHE